MALSVLFSLSSKILSTIESPAFNMAYEKGVSIWEARDELSKLQVTIETLQAVVVDAEEKQEGLVAVKNWIKRLKGVLYDAEDFFEEVIAEDLLKGKKMNKVLVFCYKLNPIVSRNSIAKKVKAIRERLVDISTDMAQFGFVQHRQISNNTRERKRERENERCSIDPKSVIGRDEEKKAILDMLTCESSEIAISNGPVVIAIDGIGGMGKTTLAHLIYNDEEVKKRFEKRWFACISNISDDKEVLGKIYQSMCESGNYRDLSMIQLESKIRESVTGKKYLLVLDDVWEDHHGNWVNRLSILSSGAKGSKIIVTSRLPSVGISMGAIRAHSLKGLSEDDSWDLFKSLAFVSGYENDHKRESLGRELLKRCRGLPLAIWCMGSLLHNKTIEEWEYIERVGLPTSGGSYKDETMSILKLSYDHLPSNLKQCFTYCCLFPEDYRYGKVELIDHWIAQGYTTSNEGESDFMHLLRMGFFQEVRKDEFGEINSCKMHDIMHDLASYLGGEESIMLSGTSSNVSSCTRYVSLMVDDEEDIPTPLLNVKSIRSCMLITPWLSRPSRLNLDQLCSNFKLLRTLSLAYMRIKHIPPSIGELKLLRYLDLDGNGFEELPDSITNLVNLLILNIQRCLDLKVWPRNFKNLINLWSLDFKHSDKLMLMPDGIGEMDHLQYLSDFRVGKRSELDVLNGLLKQLRGRLWITFCGEMEVEDGWNWQLPAAVSLQHLLISDYPGKRIRGWGNNESTSKLERLYLQSCKNVKHLPPLSCLPILKYLKLEHFWELEFMEEEEVNTHNHSTSNNLFFPCLEELVLYDLPKLKGWRKKVAAEATSTSSSSTASTSLEFSHLSKLDITDCPNLEPNSVPLCPQLRQLVLHNSDPLCPQLSSIILCPSTYQSHYVQISSSIQSYYVPLIELSSIILCPSTYQSLQEISISGCQWLSSIPGEALVSLRELVIRECYMLQSLQLASPHLLKIEIEHCEDLRSVELILESSSTIMISDCYVLNNVHIANPTAIMTIMISDCYELNNVHIANPTAIMISNCSVNNVHIANPTALQRLEIIECPELSLSTGVDWDSLTNLKCLQLFPLPSQKKLQRQLPQSLLQRQAEGKLLIEDPPEKRSLLYMPPEESESEDLSGSDQDSESEIEDLSGSDQDSESETEDLSGSDQDNEQPNKKLKTHS